MAKIETIIFQLVSAILFDLMSLSVTNASLEPTNIISMRLLPTFSHVASKREAPLGFSRDCAVSLWLDPHSLDLLSTGNNSNQSVVGRTSDCV